MALGKSLENILGNYFGEGAVNLQTKSGQKITTNKITDKILDNEYKVEKNATFDNAPKPLKSVKKIEKNKDDYKEELARSAKNTTRKTSNSGLNPSSNPGSNQTKKETISDGTNNVMVETVNIDLIQKNPFQTRTFFDESKIYSLAENIKENGLIQPIVVIRKPDDSVYLLAGERRLRACKLIGWKSILCLVKNEEEMDNAHLSLVSAMENLQREDLSPIELANTFRMLIKTQEIGESEIAKLIDKSTQYIRNYLRLLTLHPKVQDMLNQKYLSEGQARPLVGLDPDTQLKLAGIIKQKDLTVKETLRIIENHHNPQKEGDLPLKINGYNLPPEYIDKSISFSKAIPESKVKYFGNEKKGKIVVYWG